MEKLQLLVQLQKLDLQLDELKFLRGDLPEQIEDLEAELEGAESGVRQAEKFLKEADHQVEFLKGEIEQAKSKVSKYKSQQFEVRNNREYDALTKEIDAQGRFVEETEKKITDTIAQKETSKTTIDASGPKIENLKNELTERRKQLEEITRDTKDEERVIIAERKKIVEKCEKKMLDQYERIRGARDGKVIVTLKRGACGGCWKVIPLQRQAEIRKAVKVFHCEHCGRIVVSEEFYNKIFGA